MKVHTFNTLSNLLNTLSSTHNFDNIPIKKYTNIKDIYDELFSYKIFVKSDINKYRHSFRVWKCKGIFNYYLEDPNYKENCIFSLVFFINNKNDNIKIEYLSINNDFYDKKQNTEGYFPIKILLNDEEMILVKKSILKYIENVARTEKISRIIIDIHNNLFRYNEELKNEGFINTQNRCEDNPFWFKAEKKIEPLEYIDIDKINKEYESEYDIKNTENDIKKESENIIKVSDNLDELDIAEYIKRIEDKYEIKACDNIDIAEYIKNNNNEYEIDNKKFTEYIMSNMK